MKLCILILVVFITILTGCIWDTEVVIEPTQPTNPPTVTPPATVTLLPEWKSKPSDAKAAAFNENKLLLILYSRSTCTNCKTVLANLQTRSFIKFCDDNGIILTIYTQDAKGNDYRFSYDYPSITTPTFILCRPLKADKNSYKPKEDVEVISIIQPSLVDTEKKLINELK